MVYRIVIVAVLISAFAGCFKYSFKGALPSNLKTVAVPPFNDNTSYPGVRDDLTNKVVDAFVDDNTLKITDEGRADLIISGTITSIRQQASVVSKNEVVDEYQLYVNVKVKCEDIRNSKVLWDRTLRQYGILTDESERDEAISEALDKITEDILNNTLGYW